MDEYVKFIVFGYFGLMILNSLIAIIMYSNDKKRAVKGMMRIKEKHLLFIAVFFGALGSLIGRLVAHHKTDKKYFSFVIYTSLLFDRITVLGLLYIGFIM